MKYDKEAVAVYRRMKRLECERMALRKKRALLWKRERKARRKARP